MNAADRHAVRRLGQIAVFAPTFAWALWASWWIVVFPRDDHPTVSLLMAVSAAIVPLTIWLRDITHAPAWRRIAVVAQVLAQLVGVVLLVMFSGWLGWLLTGPYSGPMSAEATLYFIILAGSGCVASVCLTVLSWMLDPSASSVVGGRRALVLLSVLFLFAIVSGPWWFAPN